MVWKVFFVIVFILLILMNTFIIGYSPFLLAVLFLISLLLQVGTAFILGILYSLGWKQQLFSEKSEDVLEDVFIVISVLAYPIISAFLLFPVMYNLWNDPTDLRIEDTIFISIICSIVVSIIIAAIVNIFLIPLHIVLNIHKKNFDTLTLVNKPHWKILSLYIVPVLAGFVISAFTKYTHFASYNLIDFCAIASCVYTIIFIIGYAWNVRIYNKMFWRVTAIPYVLLMFMTPFFISDTFDQDFHFKEILLSNPTLIVFTAILSVIFIFVICKYAYKEEI